jgi:large repetitive protein
MNPSRHSISTALQAATRKGAAVLALSVLAAAAGSGSAFATIDNKATATGTYGGNPVQSNEANVSVDVAPAVPGLQVTKIATPNTNVPAGTLVTYTYTVKNSGNQTLANISLNDVHNGSGAAPLPGNETLTTDAGVPNDSNDTTANDGVWSTLAPGDVITLTSTYIVTQTDVDTKQ